MPSTAIDPNELGKGDKVVAAMALRGVPEGTEGKVEVVIGLSWIRYWVRFANGVTMGSIHRRKLATPKEWRERFDTRDDDTEADDEIEPGDDGVAAASTEGKSVNGALVPGHLLERSARARERLSA